VTEQKKAEAERNRLLAELAQKNKELESLIYIASHDLRSPLVNIQGFGRNLRKYFVQVSDLTSKSATLEEFSVEAQPILAERIPTALHFIEAGSIKMDALIDGLLRVSRIGRTILQMTPVDMDLVIQHILDAMAFQIEKAGVRVHVEKPLAECYADRNQVNQVFSNLLDNAIKYRHPNRPLTITISSRVEKQKTTYIIADTGMGIAPENQDKIWELFHRLEGDVAVPGEGLGLTLARRIIERHAGRIWVESEPGVGSQFHIELPASA
jgi:signal transduction histidine kinase